VYLWLAEGLQLLLPLQLQFAVLDLRLAEGLQL
jgi:hypothetical protein